MLTGIANQIYNISVRGVFRNQAGEGGKISAGGGALPLFLNSGGERASFAPPPEYAPDIREPILKNPQLLWIFGLAVFS